MTHKSAVSIYCEDPALSLQGPGLEYRAFKLPDGFDQEPLSRDDLQLYIAYAASFFDMESVPVNGTQHKKAFRALMDARSRL